MQTPTVWEVYRPPRRSTEEAAPRPACVNRLRQRPGSLSVSAAFPLSGLNVLVWEMHTVSRWQSKFLQLSPFRPAEELLVLYASGKSHTQSMCLCAISLASTCISKKFNANPGWSIRPRGRAPRS